MDMGSVGFRVLCAIGGLALGGVGYWSLATAGDGSADMGKAADAGEVRYSTSGYDITPLGEARIQELAKRLTPEQRRVILAKGTERAFCGTLLDNKKEGVYCCALCDLPLFASDHKFESGTGWPSFFRPVDPAHVAAEADDSMGMRRVEILCARCSGHLGHVFDDGPRPTGLRFCVNSESLEFFEKGQPMPPGAQPIETATAYFAGGCFWGIEHHFQGFPGVVSAVSGYQGGRSPSPTYEELHRNPTGHAETVRVTYDPKRVTYRELVRAFFAMHDPTQLNRQGPDVGEQYRSAIFAATPEQLAEAEAYIRTLTEAGVYSKPIVTEVRSAQGASFHEAEGYHQDYVARTGRACHAMRPITDLPE